MSSNYKDILLGFGGYVENDFTAGKLIKEVNKLYDGGKIQGESQEHLIVGIRAIDDKVKELEIKVKALKAENEELKAESESASNAESMSIWLSSGDK